MRGSDWSHPFSAFDPSNIRFYISFRALQTDYSSISNVRDITPLQKRFSM